MKTLLKLIITGLALMALSACGGDGSDDSSPVKSFNFADLNAMGYGVEFDDGEAYVVFGCGKFVRYDDNGMYADGGTYQLVGNLVELDSTVVGIDMVLETSASAPGELKAGKTYKVTENSDDTFYTKATWIQDDNQTCR